MTQQSERPAIPRAVIHQRILDAARDDPEASMEALAEEIPSATTELVERVLDEYGDPATEDPTDDGEADPATMAQSQRPVDLEDLSEAQRTTLEAIHDHPDATQSEIAERLGVSAPTICNRVGEIPGFDWEERQTFVEDLFGSERGEQPEPPTATFADGGGTETGVAQLEARLESLEQDMAGLAAHGSATLLNDPELSHKVVHACLKSDQISEEEELQILQSLLRAE